MFRVHAGASDLKDVDGTHGLITVSLTSQLLCLALLGESNLPQRVNLLAAGQLEYKETMYLLNCFPGFKQSISSLNRQNA